MRLNRKISFVIVSIFLTAAALWQWVVVPIRAQLPSDFQYRAEIFSIDNFYNEIKQGFSGGAISVTNFSYDAVDKKDGVVLVKNVFDVRTINDEEIFSVERLYGVDPKTGRHVSGYGDRAREGYLFAPRGVAPGTPYTYWHINYDAPAHLTFQDEEKIGDLAVYRYVADYHADQTENLGHLPGVGETRGVNLDINLQVWIEPVTGRLIKYEDQATAYYYDLLTGERIYPWNKFHNRYTQSSIAEQVRIATKEKKNIFLVEKVVPIGFVILAGVFLIIYFRKKKY
jgi:hypothetical protein